MPATASYQGEEVEATFRADWIRADFGVPGSPVWHQPENIEIAALSILGVDVDPKTIPADLVNAVHALADEVEFEKDYPDDL